jgi:small subunit ribosomal protein S5
MSEVKEQKNNTTTEENISKEKTEVVKNVETKKREFKKNVRSRKPQGKFERPKPEFDQKIVDVRRVTRVVKGGRRFSFSVSMVIGNRKGTVGVGIGKASDTALAIEKAMRDAKKNMLRMKLTETMSVPYEVKAKYCSSEVLIRPSKGKGVVAGSSVRTVLELAGIKEVNAKLLSRSKNKLNNAKVAIKALSVFKA